MEVMLEEEVVRERARRVIPADGTGEEEQALIFHSHRTDSVQRGNTQTPTKKNKKMLTVQAILKNRGPVKQNKIHDRKQPQVNKKK